MTSDLALSALAERYGVLGSFHDLSGRKHPTSPDTMKALLRANGLGLDNDAMIREAFSEIEARDASRIGPTELLVGAGAPFGLDLPEKSTWRLVIEGDAQDAAEGIGRSGLRLPPLPPGIHTLDVQAKDRRDQIAIIAAPRATASIESLTGQSRLWGLNAAIYAMRSERNFGLGDFEDMAQIAEAVGAQGAAFLGVNPIHALGWSDRRTISPYSPSHRGFLNTLHIAPDRIPGLENSAKSRAMLSDRRIDFAGVKAAELIDYAGFRTHIAKLLEDLFGVFLAEAGGGARKDFAAFRENRGDALVDFTLFESLSELHGPDWRAWPDGLRAPNLPGARAAGKERADRMQFHAWLQWLAAMQVSDAQTRAIRAGAPLGLYLDLAVGPRRGGAETWCERNSIAQGVSVGAPPDHLSPEGQNWNLAAYAPKKLTQDRYRAFRGVLRETMRNAGVLRIDHVLGMNRSFWIPDDGSPGAYIRQPFESLLAVIAIEADRARTAVIGEDLGLVPDGFREAINARGLYSYSVLQYEKGKDGQFRPSDTLRPHSLACFGTHDTPTLNGYRLGRDIDWWRKLGWIDEKRATAARRKRQNEVAALRSLGGEGENDANLFTPVHKALADSGVAMVSVQLDDLADESEAQNLPGTIDEHPNWRRRSATPVGSFADWPALAETGRMMAAAERSPVRAAEKENVR